MGILDMFAETLQDLGSPTKEERQRAVERIILEAGSNFEFLYPYFFTENDCITSSIIQILSNSTSTVDLCLDWLKEYYLKFPHYFGEDIPSANDKGKHIFYSVRKYVVKPYHFSAFTKHLTNVNEEVIGVRKKAFYKLNQNQVPSEKICVRRQLAQEYKDQSFNLSSDNVLSESEIEKASLIFGIKEIKPYISKAEWDFIRYHSFLIELLRFFLKPEQQEKLKNYEYMVSLLGISKKVLISFGIVSKEYYPFKFSRGETQLEDQRLEKWKQKLLDLSKRNRVLNFRTTKRSNLRIVEPEFQTVFEWLVNGNCLEFVLREHENDELNLFDLEEEKKDEINENKKELRPGQLLTDRTDSELIKTLAQIRSKAKLAMEEQGVNILYLAFGLLRWTEFGSKVEFESPLLLVPVSLSIESLWDNYKIEILDDDILVNPTLLFKLDKDFGLQLPLFEDSEEQGLIPYFEKIQNFIEPHGWHLEPQIIHLGLFSFHKINMYQDLMKHGSAITGHPVIKAFLGDKSDIMEVPEDLQDFDHDAIVRPLDTFQVLDADSSQQDAVIAAKKGMSFVLQGPPGTGKSQTITNIIAESLADGKKVLFVSEKMAALEVVYKRLHEANLTDFCLELHSRKTNKRDVLKELGRTLNVSRIQTRDEALAELNQLLEDRKHLNEYVKSIHTRCEPLGKTIYEVHGILQKYNCVADVVFDIADVEKLTSETINNYQRLLADFARTAGNLGTTYNDNVWKGCTLEASTLETQDTLRVLFRRLDSFFEEIEGFIKAFKEDFNLEIDSTFTGAMVLKDILSVSARSTKPPLSWFHDVDIETLAQEASTYLNRFEEHKNILNEILEEYHQDILQLPAEQLRYRFESNLEQAFSKINKKEYLSVEDLIVQKEKLGFNLSLIRTKTSEIIALSKELSSLLGLDLSQTFDEVQNLLNVARLVLEVPHPTEAWFNKQGWPLIKESFTETRAIHEKIIREKEVLFDDYDESVLSIDYQAMLTRFRVEYNSIFKHLKPTYKKDLKEIKGHQKVIGAKQKDEEIVEVLQQIKKINEQITLINDNQENLKSTFGFWYCQGNTRWGDLETALENFEHIVKIISHRPMPTQLKDALLKQENLTTIRALYNCLDDLTQGGVLETVERTLDFFRPTCQVTLDEINATSSTSQSLLEKAFDTYQLVMEKHVGQKQSSYRVVQEDLKRLSSLQEIEYNIKEKSLELKEKFAHYFEGLSTDWESILKSLAWSAEFKNTVQLYNLPKHYVEVICCINGRDISNVKERADKLSYLLDGNQSDFNHLVSIFDQEVDFPNRELKSVKYQLEQCLNDFLALEEWIDFRFTYESCKSVGLEDFLIKVMEAGITGSDIPKTFFKRFYRLWLDAMYQHYPAVLHFRRQSHERLIKEFRELDEKQLKIARARVKERLCRNLPSPHRFTSGKDELGVLQREINKRRRIMPLRKLFKNIPNLLLALKPCFMMSPLTVSIFLDPETYRFDLVIFDEASQICTEDAVGAIFRGSQIIIAGDCEQLPPTNFFAVNTEEDQFDNDEEEDYDVGSYESVLDEAKAFMPEETLLWHYRSRHEHLIAFSNAKIYKNLITFPSSTEKAEGQGVEYIYVPEGIYDRSGKRDNKIEAEKVAQIVIDNFIRFPNYGAPHCQDKFLTDLS